MARSQPDTTKSLIKTYLTAYNGVSTILWSVLGWKIIVALVRGYAFLYETLWNEISYIVLVAQSLAVVEPLHVLLGLTKGSSFASFVQVGSRLQVILVVWMQVPEARNKIFVLTCLSAWTLTEVFRYPFYILKTLDIAPPDWLSWLRYSQFMVLYPIGIGSEVAGVVIAARQFWKFSTFYPGLGPMPNFFNFEVNLLAIEVFMMCVYAPGSVYLYSYMLRQRKKILNEMNLKLRGKSA